VINLDIDLLRTFVTIAEAHNFTRAAERLGRTQSAISLQMRRLEEALERKLLERGPRMVKPTAEGEVLLAYARHILRVNDEAVSRLMEPDLHGVVRLGTPEDFATIHLPEVLASFARAYPRVALEVSCDLTLNLLDRFQAGEFDLILIKREPQGPFGGIKVWREPLVWAALDRSLLATNDVIPLIVAPHPCVYRKRAISALDEVRKRWRIAYTSTSLAGSHAAVRAGLGVTVLPKDMVPQGFQVLGPNDGLPELHDTEIAMKIAPGMPSKPTERLADHIFRTLEVADQIKRPVGTPGNR